MAGDFNSQLKMPDLRAPYGMAPDFNSQPKIPDLRPPYGMAHDFNSQLKIPDFRPTFNMDLRLPFNMAPPNKREMLMLLTTKYENSAKVNENALKAKNNVGRQQAKEVPPNNVFEKCIIYDVIDANEKGFTVADADVSDDIKRTLQVAMVFALRRPELFEDGLVNPWNRILLSGPFGTQKKMLAKAMANEARASFILVSMSTITPTYFNQRNLRSLFTLAAKVGPTIIFLDESTIQNEFMVYWDELLTLSGAQTMVIASTKSPFDLDQAIIDRFQLRIMVGPSSAKRKQENLDFKELPSTMTQRYGGIHFKEKKKTEAEVRRSENASSAIQKIKEDQVYNSPNSINSKLHVAAGIDTRINYGRAGAVE
ncbi:uncharacterized AAA domain-containing protein C24B10.10c [Gastrolobium bilobum]|uniref:uncharacterized AAA domain-containing protein C24B10.10c n=1 Tax=Gastrolobium bilobum TaxID=150636 RepID=UPI002AB1D982|nr:uncharacterized AAA domain-containing protein C24B10.10c [Gastrolobium bilobum]